MRSKKLDQAFFKISKYTFFNSLKTWSAKNWAAFFLRCLSTLILIFEKGQGKKTDPVSFKICKFTLFDIWKADKEKVGLGFFKICKYTFFNI